MKIKKLYRGSKNPPTDVCIFLQTKWGDWGIGEMFKYDKKATFNFKSFDRTLIGEEKSSFISWMEIPE